MTPRANLSKLKEKHYRRALKARHAALKRARSGAVDLTKGAAASQPKPPKINIGGGDTTIVVWPKGSIVKEPAGGK